MSVERKRFEQAEERLRIYARDHGICQARGKPVPMDWFEVAHHHAGVSRRNHAEKMASSLRIINQKTQLYHRYQIIRDRCNNPNNKKYRLYGERGINRSVPGRATAIFNDTTGFGIHVLIAFEV